MPELEFSPQIDDVTRGRLEREVNDFSVTLFFIADSLSAWLAERGLIPLPFISPAGEPEPLVPDVQYEQFIVRYAPDRLTAHVSVEESPILAPADSPFRWDIVRGELIVWPVDSERLSPELRTLPANFLRELLLLHELAHRYFLDSQTKQFVRGSQRWWQTEPHAIQLHESLALWTCWHAGRELLPPVALTEPVEVLLDRYLAAVEVIERAEMAKALKMRRAGATAPMREPHYLPFFDNRTRDVDAARLLAHLQEQFPEMFIR